MRTFEFAGIGNCKSLCGLDVIPCDDMNIVIATELPENLGTTVANGTECIVNCVTGQLGIDLDSIVWLVHFPEGLIPDQKEIYMLVQGERDHDNSLKRGSLAWKTITGEIAMEFLFGDNPMIGQEIRLVPPEGS